MTKEKVNEMVRKIMAVCLIGSAAALGILFEGGDVTGAAMLVLLCLPVFLKEKGRNEK